MKHFTGIVLTALFTISLLCACNEDWNPEELLEPPTGEISLTGLSIVIDNSSDIISDNFIVRICDNDSIVKEWQYNQMPETVTLNEGNYTLEAVSHDPEYAEWDNPYFKGTKTFNVYSEKTTSITSIECAVASVGVSVSYSDDVISLIDPNAIVTVCTTDDHTLDFTLNETRTAHFILDKGNSSLVARFDGIVDRDTVVCTKALSDIGAGSNVIIEFTANDLIKIDAAKAPAITSETLDIDGVNVITGDLVAKVDINAPYGIERFDVKIISEQLTQEELQGVGLDSEFDLANPGDLAAPLTELGFPTGDQVKGMTQMQFDITMFMELLVFFPGTHQFQLTITDAKGLSTTATLTFLAETPVDPNTPAITSETLDIDGVNVITGDLVAKVDINAPYGIERFDVKIISEQLTQEELQGVGLDSEFDLANPGDLAAPLTELGFPTGDQVKGMTQMQFDITMFMELLVFFPGTHQFQLTITDAKGLSTTATLTFLAQ